MTLDDFISSGGATVWHFAPRGTASAHMWGFEGVLGGNQFFAQMLQRIWLGAAIVLMAMFFADCARLLLGGRLESEWKLTVFRFLFAACLLAAYPQVAHAPAEVADAVMYQIADDASCNTALFTMMTVAEKGMLATFNPTGADGVSLGKQSDKGFVQGLAYTAFFLIWWILPMAMAGILMGFYLVGPYCLAFMAFRPLFGIAGMWAKMFCGMFLAYVMLCIAFFLLLSSQVTLAASASNAASDPFTTIAFSLAGLLVACSMPSFAVRLLGGRMSFLPGRR